MHVCLMHEWVMLQGLWTDGQLAFTAGLDQRVHCWRLKHSKAGFSTSDIDSQSVLRGDEGSRPAACANAAHASLQLATAEGQASSSPEQNWNRTHEVILKECCSSMTQVLEPAALDACRSSRTMYNVLVVGRGTQLLSLHVGH